VLGEKFEFDIIDVGKVCDEGSSCANWQEWEVEHSYQKDKESVMQVQRDVEVWALEKMVSL